MITKFKKTENRRRLVLIVDDEYVNRELLGYILNDDYDLLYAENGKEALKMIRENSQALSLVLLDLFMPEMNGFELLEVLREDEELKGIPVIVLTSEKSAEVKSLKLGAADFIKKPYDVPEVILARVFRIIELSEDKLIIQETERDALTGLYNKQFFYKYAQHINRYHNKDKQMDYVVVNIDNFHLINEIYGRQFGDELLKFIAVSFRKFLIDVYGIACRVEADTFYMYCEHQESYEGLLEQIINVLTEITKTRIRLRMGIYDRQDQELEDEIKFDYAKLACNRIKGNFATSIAYYDMELHKSQIYSQRLINDIHEAIEQKQLMVFYQPKYGITTDEPQLRSAEALIRWRHPELGMISPGAFIPLFEENGLIQLLDDYVWKEAAAQIRAWKDKFGVTLPVSVNVSRIDIYDPNLKDNLLQIVEKNGLTTKDLYLEVTESAYAEDAGRLIEVVEELRRCGFKIEMDDFGSGYSSLNMLSTLPIDVLKLDMKFVRNMLEDSKSYRLIEIIMDIAKYLAVPVVAEGVEVEEQLKLLKQVGCEIIQGYYFSKPVPPEEFEKFFE